MSKSLTDGQLATAINEFLAGLTEVYAECSSDDSASVEHLDEMFFAALNDLVGGPPDAPPTRAQLELLDVVKTVVARNRHFAKKLGISSGDNVHRAVLDYLCGEHDMGFDDANNLGVAEKMDRLEGDWFLGPGENPQNEVAVPDYARKAYAAFTEAERHGGAATDDAAYDWLAEYGADDHTLGTRDTFKRYLGEYRKATDTQKKQRTLPQPSRSIVPPNQL